MSGWTHKLPNCYFVCPDGSVTTAPAADPQLLRSPLVHELLGLDREVAPEAGTLVV